VGSAPGSPGRRKDSVRTQDLGLSWNAIQDFMRLSRIAAG
jgi:hypothetical protein